LMGIAMEPAVDEFAEELAQGKTFMCESCDGLRRPVYITISSRHFRANHNLEQNMRSCVYYMDLALRMGEAMGSDGRVTNIVDCRGEKTLHIQVFVHGRGCDGRRVSNIVDCRSEKCLLLYTHPV
jgi:hypothetical protein